MTQTKKSQALDIRAAIKEAVNAGLRAGEEKAKHTAADAYKATERRLYAYPVLQQKVEADKARLESIQTAGTPERSKSIVRYTKSGLRLSADEILDVMIQDLKANIEADEYELAAIDSALTIISKDSYYQTVREKYMRKKSDDEIAVALYCDPSTVRRNRGRLIRMLAVRLYGATAI